MCRGRAEFPTAADRRRRRRCGTLLLPRGAARGREERREERKKKKMKYIVPPIAAVFDAAGESAGTMTLPEGQRRIPPEYGHAFLPAACLATTEMCSRDPPTLHPALAKANGKNSSPQPAHHTEAQRINGNLLPTPGGCLKFFKDDKFILELSHRRDGEKTTWFPVPKKTR